MIKPITEQQVVMILKAIQLVQTGMHGEVRIVVSQGEVRFIQPVVSLPAGEAGAERLERMREAAGE